MIVVRFPLMLETLSFNVRFTENIASNPHISTDGISIFIKILSTPRGKKVIITVFILFNFSFSPSSFSSMDNFFLFKVILSRLFYNQEESVHWHHDIPIERQQLIYGYSQIERQTCIIAILSSVISLLLALL